MKLGWHLLALTTLVLTVVVAQTSSDMKDVELQTTLQGQPGTTLSLALSPDGHTLASGVGRINADAVVALWDYPSGLQKRIYRFDGDYSYHDHSVRSMSFSTDSSQLVVGLGDKDVALLNVQTGALVWRSPVHSGVVFGVAYSPDGKTVASGSIDGRAVVLDAKTGQIIHVLSGTKVGSVRSLAFSPDSTTLATANGNGSVGLWNVSSGTERIYFSAHTGPVRSLAFSPDGQFIATGGEDNAARIFDIKGLKIMVFKGHTKTIHTVAFSRDGLSLATGSTDGTVRLWDVKTGQEKMQLRVSDDVVSNVVFSSDDKSLLTGGKDGTHVWNISSLQEQARFEDFSNSQVTSLAFGSDGRTLASTQYDSSIVLWDVATSKKIKRFDGHDGYPVTSALFVNNGQTLVSSGNDGFIRFWDTVTGTNIPRFSASEYGHETMKDMTLSLDGQRLAATSRLRGLFTTHVWDLTSMQELNSYNNVSSPAFSPDGLTIATLDFAGHCQIWNLADKQPAKRLRTRAALSFSDVEFSPDGKLIVATGQNISQAENSVLVFWDALTGQEKSTLKLESDALTLAFSPNGRVLATGELSGVVTLWDVSSFKVLKHFNTNDGEVNAIRFSPDGTRIAIASHTTRIYATSDFKPIFKTIP